MAIALIIFFFVLLWLVVFEVPTFVIGLGLALIGAIVAGFFILRAKFMDRIAYNVVRADLIDEVAVYKEKIQNTGFSIGWNLRSGRSYYRYKNVLDHYECVFRVVFQDGKIEIIKCKKFGALYNELIKKTIN